MADQQESEGRLPDELEELHRALKSLEPLPGRLDRSRLMYLAGRASAGVSASGTSAAARKRNWAWPVSTAAMTLVAATLAVALAVRPQPQPRVVRETVYVKQPALPDEPDSRRPLVFDAIPQRPASADEPGGSLPSPYVLSMSMRRTVLEQGVDALPDVVLSGIGPPSTSRQMLESMLDAEPESRARNGEKPGPIKFDWKSFIFPGEML